VRGLRQLNVGSLSVAHVTKGGQVPIGPMQQKPFGSVFYHNSFRRTYFAKQDGDSAGDDMIKIAIWNPKVNEGGQQAPFGIEIEFDEHVTTIRRCDVADIEEAAKHLPSKQRIAGALRAGAQTTVAMAEQLDMKPEAVKRALQRGRGSLFVCLVEAAGLWALRAKD